MKKTKTFNIDSRMAKRFEINTNLFFSSAAQMRIEIDVCVWWHQRKNNAHTHSIISALHNTQYNVNGKNYMQRLYHHHHGIPLLFCVRRSHAPPENIVCIYFVTLMSHAYISVYSNQFARARCKNVNKIWILYRV